MQNFLMKVSPNGKIIKIQIIVGNIVDQFRLSILKNNILSIRESFNPFQNLY